MMKTTTPMRPARPAPPPPTSATGANASASNGIRSNPGASQRHANAGDKRYVAPFGGKYANHTGSAFRPGPPSSASCSSSSRPPLPPKPDRFNANLIPLSSGPRPPPQASSSSNNPNRTPTTLSSLRGFRELTVGDDEEPSLLKKYQELHRQRLQQEQEQQQQQQRQDEQYHHNQPPTRMLTSKPPLPPRPLFEVTPKSAEKGPFTHHHGGAVPKSLQPPPKPVVTEKATPAPRPPVAAPLVTAAVAAPSVAVAEACEEMSAQEMKARLLRAFPSCPLTTEQPSNGNGNKFQVRAVLAEEVFIGRGTDEEEALRKCCSKALRFIRMYWMADEGRFLAPHERKKGVPGSSGASSCGTGSTCGGGPSPPLAPSEQRQRRQPLRQQQQVQQHHHQQLAGSSSRRRPQQGPDRPLVPYPRPPPPPGPPGPPRRDRTDRGAAAYGSSANTIPLGGGRKGGFGQLAATASNPPQRQHVFGHQQQYNSHSYNNNRRNGGGRHYGDASAEDSYYYPDSNNNRKGKGAAKWTKGPVEVSWGLPEGSCPAQQGGEGLEEAGSAAAAASRDEGGFSDAASSSVAEDGLAEKKQFKIPTLVITSEDNEEEFCEFIEEKLKPNVPIKNAVMMLNELFPPPKAPQYKVTSQTGPPNNPTFTMVCTINGKSFNGEGKSKKEAKLACSQKAIEVLYGYKVTETKSVPERSNPRANCDLEDWMELEGKNPVSILNELYPGIQYQLVSTTGPSHAPQFVIKASLNDMSFEGSGKSKKDAKLNASKALLVHLHKVGFDPMTGDMMSTQVNQDGVAEGHSFADQIGQLVTAKYQALFGTTTYSKRRVMSGIVMTRGDRNSVENSEVVCVSSGTKCINGEQLSLEGCVINDSHAEIVTRRCLVVYLYCQLEMLDSEDEERRTASIFEPTVDSGNDEEEQGACKKFFQLKEGIEFHLFITTSPCGDARIFSLHESPSSNALGNSSNMPASASSASLTANSSCSNLAAASGVSGKDRQVKADPEEIEREEASPQDKEVEKDDAKETSAEEEEAVGDNSQVNETFKETKQESEEPSGENGEAGTDCQKPQREGEAEGEKEEVGPDAAEDAGEEVTGGEDKSSACPSEAGEGDDAREQQLPQPLPSDDARGQQLPQPPPSEADSAAPSENGDAKSEAGASEGGQGPTSADRRRLQQQQQLGQQQAADSSRGMLRSKIECGMGTVPINPKILVQTWDGVMSGDRLLTMACSDKILRWNVLGIQGALLTHLVKPIYLKSVTVGSKYHPGHMKRALYERITPYIVGLPPSYCVNVPELCATTSPETRQATKAHDYSVNWIVDQGQPEIVNGSTGKTINDNTSRLSKKCLFERFLQVNDRLMPSSPFVRPVRYSEVKKLAATYQEAKSRLVEALFDAGCGHWIEKPVEQDQFSM